MLLLLLQLLLLWFEWTLLLVEQQLVSMVLTPLLQPPLA
jgi:hypothetical protein